MEAIIVKRLFCAIFFLLSFSMMVFLNIGKAEDAYFKGYKRSLIEWDDLDHKKWLSFKKWKEKYEKREKFPPWERLKKRTETQRTCWSCNGL